MCLIIFGYKANNNFPLVVAANRDEQYDRPTASSHFWQDHPDILAGRDLLANGTWMGISRKGLFAAVTNGSESLQNAKTTLSRGMLTVDFLNGNMSAQNYVHNLSSRSELYNSFHLIVYDGNSMWYLDSKPTKAHSKVFELIPGIYGLSNAGINSGWYKCKIGEEKMSTLLHRTGFEISTLMEVVSDQSLAPKSQLISLGLTREEDYSLSAQFVSSGSYGTRCSTLLTIDSQHTTQWIEKSFDSSSNLTGTVSLKFLLEK